MPKTALTHCKVTSKSRQTLFFSNPVYILSGGSVVAKRESKGPVGKYFDKVFEENIKIPFEKEELSMLKKAITLCIDKSKLKISDIDMLFAGDLLNQITSSCFAARDLKIPFFGLYSACSTFTQALASGASFINAGYFDNVACATASHFASAERQFRNPLEYGAQRPPYSQWTVTGAGCTMLSNGGDNDILNIFSNVSPRITSATYGKVVDFGIKDVANMGGAMAPSALDTLICLLSDTGYSVEDFDLIITGDLGKLGSDMLRDLALEQGILLGKNYTDCGVLIYDSTQDCYQGGSGAGCSAVVFNGFILEMIKQKRYKRIALLATGALLSPQSVLQGESIPGICHGVVIEI
ncbi:MAG: stage V sporulation protein AD [Firmicutes bacterium]|nr:stage V sporulation protein AD [Bacillota bacterium]